MMPDLHLKEPAKTGDVTAAFYDDCYHRSNFFHYSKWLYKPLISSLVKVCKLRAGASLLDVGCGQGLFSYLFSCFGLEVHGVDLSHTGILQARKLYGNSGVSFSVSDIRTSCPAEKFDCIFVRSCSIYNRPDFSAATYVTENLLQHLKAGGTFIFVYNSSLSSRNSTKWRHHSISEVRQHFSRYPTIKIYFLNKALTALLGTYSFTALVSRASMILSRTTGVGGEIICILKGLRETSDELRA